jgi:transposase InsO family protein
MTEGLVMATLRKALLGGWVKPNIIIHTDKGSPFVSKGFRLLLKENRLRQSMSGKDNCCG